jgi:hypothetical protein
MVLLKTQAGYLSSLWILTLRQRGQGDWSVSYNMGSGPLDTICSGPDGHAFVERFRLHPG